MAQASSSLSPSIYLATGSAYWASYLINGDASGLSDEERAQADAWCERELGPNDAVIDCGEPWFTWSYQLYTGVACCGGDVVDYRVMSW
jgi:hypothetical protein